MSRGALQLAAAFLLGAATVLGFAPFQLFPVPLLTLAALAWLWRTARLVVEPGGAAALAALMTGAWTAPAELPVGVVLCGGNADALPG
jgi:threonine dehydratase